MDARELRWAAGARGLLRWAAGARGARRRVESIMASLLGQVCTAPLIGGFGCDALTPLETNDFCKLHRLSARDEYL